MRPRWWVVARPHARLDLPSLLEGPTASYLPSPFVRFCNNNNTQRRSARNLVVPRDRFAGLRRRAAVAFLRRTPQLASSPP